MSRTLSRWQSLVLGVVVLLGVGLGGFGLFVVGARGWPGHDDLHVQAGFREIRGVEVGTRVRLQGIEAGEVVAIVPPQNPADPVVLRLRVKGPYRHLVRVSSKVQIVSEGMLGGKVVEIRPPVAKNGETVANLDPAEEDAMLSGESALELADVLAHVGETIKGVQEGKGTLGQLATDAEVYEALVELLQNGNEAVQRSKETMSAIQRDADALKKVPFIGKHIEDPVALLVRPSCERNRRVYAEGDLFEPGRAVLTSQGKASLDELGVWFGLLKSKGSDLVVVSYADAKKGDDRLSQEVTRQQSEAVLAYLKSKHKAHKIGWVTSRKVTALGMGAQAPPMPEREALPAARVEVVVFVPQG